MSMLHSFFDIQKDSKELFDGLRISRDSEICTNYMNQYPTIFITLRNVEGLDFQFAFSNFKAAVQDMYKSHSVLAASSKLEKEDRELFSNLSKAKGTEFETVNALKTLIHFLYLHYNKPVIIINL